MIKKVLLHSCCGDCAWKMAASNLAETEPAELTIYYYNPNIHPRSEYQSRLKAMQIVAKNKGIKIIIPDWKPGEYFTTVKKNDKNRCQKCWKLRLGKTAKEAKARGFKYFSTTLLTSHYQNEDEVRKIGLVMEKKYGVKLWIPKKILKEVKTKGFYKQIYCGCIYSLVERWEEKYLKGI